MKPRAPWWMWFLAATFVLYGGFVVYVNHFGPEPIGATFKFDGGRMVLLTVESGGPADRAGLRPGDVLLSADRIPTQNQFSWVAARSQVELGHPQPIEVERDGRRLSAAVTSLHRVRGSAFMPATSNSVFVVLLVMKVIGFGLVFVILWQRPRDPAALFAAWFLASAMSATGIISTGMAATFRQLPAPVGVLLVFPFFCNVAFMAPILFTFAALFPRRLFRSNWPFLAAWVLMVAEVLVSSSIWYRFAYRPESLHAPLPDWLWRVHFFLFFVIVAAALGVMFANYRRLEDVNDRRRVRVVVMGFVISWAVTIPALFAFNVDPSHVIARPFFNPVLAPVLILLTVVGPASLTYAVLRHRIFDLRLMVRQGLQYAVARRALVAAVPAMAGILVLDLLTHRQQTVGEVLRERGWAYGLLAVAALFAHHARDHWLAALDRRFFRERYDAQHLLREVLDDVRDAQTLEAVAPVVAAKIEAALHPEYVCLLARDASSAFYSAIATAPASAAPPSVRADGKLIGMLRLLGKPLEISSSESSWLKDQLPAGESEWLRLSRVDLIIPVALPPAAREAVLLLGPKRSEEPYSREDKEFLLSIAGSLRLLLERPAVAAVADTSFRECPQCGLCAGSTVAACPSDGTALTVIGAPRMLAGRYRLERRIGRGGMGSVYAARDTALEREVATKLVREELVGSSSAAHRFQQEARAAAAFTHPHVVTIYDYGLADTRAFLVMELLKGRSLREEIRQQGRLPSDRVASIFRGVCAAVEAAHRRGLIHRDLKPENIFLARGDESEVAKILDFGLVKAMTDDTQLTTDTAPGTAVGTVVYFSPEQWTGAPPAASFDCWALAVTMYETLRGEHPFVATSHEDLRSAVLRGQFKPTGEGAWDAFFQRALAVDPAMRPGTAAVLLTEFEGVLRRAAAMETNA